MFASLNNVDSIQISLLSRYTCLKCPHSRLWDGVNQLNLNKALGIDPRRHTFQMTGAVQWVTKADDIDWECLHIEYPLP